MQLPSALPRPNLTPPPPRPPPQKKIKNKNKNKKMKNKKYTPKKIPYISGNGTF